MKALFQAVIIAGVVVTQGCNQQAENLEKFKKITYQQINPQQFQEWAVSLIRTNTESRPYVDIDKLQLPSFLTATNPPTSAEIQKTGNGNESMVFINWGNGFGHWGLIVGETNLAIPKGLQIRVSNWKPRIYFYQDIQ